MSAVTWKPAQSILKARNLAHLIAYLQENDARLASQAHLYDGRRVNDALYALDEQARAAENVGKLALPSGNVSYANGARFGTHLLVLRYPAHKLAVFLLVSERRESVALTAPQHRPEQYLQAQDATMGMLPAALMNSHEVAQVARNSVRVHMGFAGAYEEIQQAVAIQARRCLDAGITMFASVGHGFAGAVASLMAVHLNVVSRERLAPSAAVGVVAAVGAATATAAAAAALQTAVDTATAEVTLAISDVANGVVSAVNAVSPNKQMTMARKQMGTTADPAHYFMNPLFSSASVRLITFGAVASGNVRWCDMVSVATLGDWERYVMSNDPLVALPASPSVLARYAHPQTHVMTLPFVSTRAELHPVLTQVSEAVKAEQEAAASLLAADLHAQQQKALMTPAPAPAVVTAPAVEEQAEEKKQEVAEESAASAPAAAASDAAPAAAASDAAAASAPAVASDAAAPEAAAAPAVAPAVAPSTVGTFALAVLAFTTAFSNLWHGTVMYAVERNAVAQWKLASDARTAVLTGTVRASQVTGNSIAHYEAGLALYDA